MITTHTRAADTADGLGPLFRDLERYPSPTRDEQLALAKRVAAGDAEARKQMVAVNMRLVVHWARRYQDRGVDLADLVQEGTFGLLRAVQGFDWERGFQFSTYATWWIRQALQRAVQQCGRSIRVPQDVGERLQRLDTMVSELGGRLGRRPTEEELTEATGMTGAQRRALEAVPRVTASLDQLAAADSSTLLGDLVASDANWADGVDERVMFEQVRAAVDRLPAFQRDVLRLRFGLDGDAPASLRVTADRLGAGVRRVQTVEREALAALSASHRARAGFRGVPLHEKPC